MNNDTDTIAAIITPPGRGGVGIVRVCGKTIEPFIVPLLGGTKLAPRMAVYRPFLDGNGEDIDRGLALYFPAPGSYTGEETLELHGHGGPVVMDRLLQRVISIGARQARPGEFSERAFLNGKLDLAQAEAVADLIEATTEQAAQGAARTLRGQFSRRIDTLRESLVQLRVYVEAAIDFPEEEIDFLSDGKVERDLHALSRQIAELLQQTSQGVLLTEGMAVAIAGKPNAGKSSLLNMLAGYDRAIVTDVPGTTRDILMEQINLDGLPVRIIDTAGLRDSIDPVEQEGIRRAWQQIAEADQILWVVDSSIGAELAAPIWPEYQQRFPGGNNVTVVLNKIDLRADQPKIERHGSQHHPTIAISAQTGEGVNSLRDHLKMAAGFAGASEGLFTARRRHLSALEYARASIELAVRHLQGVAAGELVAEELRQAQNQLEEITGMTSSDDLLGVIFSSFCIGK